MILLNCDYNEGAHERILQAFVKTNMEQTQGYGEDMYCERATDVIRTACDDETVAVHFLVGGTQANLTIIDAALRTYQGVLAAESAHICVHESGAIEACGHKVLPLPSKDGKITAKQVKDAYEAHIRDDSFEHMVQPKLVYISNPTELGTIYSKDELEALHDVCKQNGLFLFMDGARLGYGLAATDNTLTLSIINQCCDVFYIGGTKLGALFGEAVVIRNEDLKRDFRYIIKQKGGLLAKGRLLGIQFLELLQDGLYMQLAKHANQLADQIRNAMIEKGYPFLVENKTNQIFGIFLDEKLERLGEKYSFSYQCRIDETHSAVRFCTSWATKEEDVIQFVEDLKAL